MYFKKSLALGIIVLTIGIFFGCGKREKKIIAWVDGKEIVFSDFNDKLSQMPPYFQENEAQRRKFLDSLIDREILLSEAKKRNMSKDKAVKKRLDVALEQIIIEELIKKAIPETDVNEDVARKYYEERKELFLEPEKVRVSQILVRSEQEAQDILRQLKEEKNFAALARANSISPDSVKGGDIGFFGRGEILPEFEAVAFSLKEGETSDIVRSPFGFHILKVTEKKEQRQKNFEEAKEEIEVILRQKQQREILDDWFKGLRKKAKIKINETLIVQSPVGTEREDENKRGK